MQQLAADTLELVFGRSASLPLAQHWHVLAAHRVVAAVERGAQLTAGVPG